MKTDRTILFPLIIITGLFITMQAAGQAVRYKHPHQEISFEASPNWVQELQDHNGEEYWVTHPNQNMQIGLSFVPDCRHPYRYMRRISGLQGMVCPRDHFDTILNDHRAVLIRGECIQGKEPFRKMLIGFPFDNGLYLVEICCPAECYMVHKERVKSILGTIRVGALSTI
jgi:hypothetical protein